MATLDTSEGIGTDVEQITLMIWETMFDFPIERTEAAIPEGAPLVTSIIHLHGAWHGAVVLQCPMPLADELATTMFRSTSDTTFVEVQDALGELTNMLAGNVKALLPQPTSISLPAVALGSDYEIGVMGTTLTARVQFRCKGGVFAVSLLRSTADAEALR